MALIRPPDHRLTRRALLGRSALAGGGLVAATGLRGGALAQQSAPAVITSERMRPSLPYGVQSGDLAGDRAIIWARADRPARMMVEWATTESFDDARVVARPGGARGQRLHRQDRSRRPAARRAGVLPGRAWSISPTTSSRASRSPAASGRRLRRRRDIRFVWSGDTAGQGWGINPDWGGMKIYETMRQVEPAFFIHSGDTIYADGPIAAEVRRCRTAASGRT